MGIFVYNGLHGRLPTDVQTLKGVPATVLQLTATDVGLPDVGQIDKRYSLQIDAQQKQIVGKGQKRTLRKMKKTDGTDGLQRNGTLGGTGKIGEDVTENVLVGSQTHADSLMVERTEAAGEGIALQTTAFQPGFVQGNQLAVERIEN